MELPKDSTEEYKAGALAASDDYPVMHKTTCPHSIGTVKADEWMNGYAHSFDWIASQPWDEWSDSSA